MSKEINQNKVVVFTGAGVSAESGIKTFRDSNGLWNEHAVEDVATYAAWKRNSELVLAFYNARREEICNAQPNAAHRSIADLQDKYEVVVITQNIDDLHERAGSNNVIHVHGEITKARSEIDNKYIVNIGYEPIVLGNQCPQNGQLRPHIVWFGEQVFGFEKAKEHFKTAKRVLIVGTSLSVYPVAGLLKRARYHAEKIIVSFDIEKKPFGYKLVRGKATDVVPYVSDCWLKEKRAV